jgi:arabinose-5-phosphate isomerase
VNKEGHLVGLFTDSTLSKLFAQRLDAAFDQPISEVMTPNPYRVSENTLLGEALSTMSAKKASELPVVDKDGLRRPRSAGAPGGNVCCRA